MEKQKRLPQLSLIFAMDENNIIGKDNSIPWKSPHDFRWFRFHTLGHTVIMGRKTWESLPDESKPLFDRINYIITSDPNYVTGREASGAGRVFIRPSMKAAIRDALLRNAGEQIFVIGGKALLEEASEYATKAFISHIGVKTALDETCVMAPKLPEYTISEINVLFHGDEVSPSVTAQVVHFN